MRASLANRPGKLRILANSQGAYRLWLYRNIAINHWLSDLTMTGVMKLMDLTADRQKECPEGVASIHWLAPGVGLPNTKVRTGLRDIMTRFPGHVTSVGVVFETEGFFAAAMRSAVTGIVLLSPTQIPLRVFGKLDDLTRWLPDLHQRATGTKLTRDELTEVFQEVLSAGDTLPTG